MKEIDRPTSSDIKSLVARSLISKIKKEHKTQSRGSMLSRSNSSMAKITPSSLKKQHPRGNSHRRKGFISKKNIPGKKLRRTPSNMDK